MDEELLKLYYPLDGYILIVRRNKSGTINLIEEAVEENGKTKRLWDKPRTTILSGTDAEYLEQLIEKIKGCASLYVARKFGDYKEVDWKSFEFVYAINGDDLYSDLMDSFYIDEGFELYFDPCPEPQCIPPFTPYVCKVKGITARLLRYHKKGEHEKAIGYGWVVEFDVWQIKRCIMGFVDHLKWYYNELKKLEEDAEVSSD